MSNAYIAAFRTPGHESLERRLLEICDDGKVTVNSPQLDYEAEAQIQSNTTSALVWIRSRQHDPYQIYTRLGAELQCPWIVVSFLEHIVWEYQMYEGSTLVDEFVPAPEIWDLDEPKLGDAEKLNRIWGVKPERVQRYLRRWDSSLKVERAYFGNDHSCYKSPEQGYDFLHAITGLRFPEC